MTGLEILAGAAIGGLVEAGAKTLFKSFTNTRGFKQAYVHTAQRSPQPQVTGM